MPVSHTVTVQITLPHPMSPGTVRSLARYAQLRTAQLSIAESIGDKPLTSIDLELFEIAKAVLNGIR